MLSDTLNQELKRYRIGPRVRALRLRKKLGLVQLGEHTGLSPAMLSKIERGQVYPTLPTLLRVAMVFGVGLEHFFIEEGEGPLMEVVRKDQRLRLPDRPENEAPAYFFESLDYPVADRKMESFLAEFPPDAVSSKPHAHGSAELVFVIAGRLAITVGEEAQVILEPEDALYFDSGVPHSYRCAGSTTARALVVTVE